MLGWPRTILLNYIQGNASATVLCPIMHAWSWQYGRNNHGHAQLVQPWSGHFQLGAPLFGQAQITQFTGVGWRLLPVGSGAALVTDPDLVYATFVAPAQAERQQGDAALPVFSWVAVYADAQPLNVTLQLTGFLFPPMPREAPVTPMLQLWCTTAQAYMRHMGPVQVTEQGTVHVTLPPRSVCTATSWTAAGNGTVPAQRQRQPLPLPQMSSFDTQRIGAPGRLLADLYGGWGVQAEATVVAASGRAATSLSLSSSNLVLQQAAPADPGKNAWKSRDGMPFTAFPTGANLAHANCSARVLWDAVAPGGHVRLCGRVGIWQPGSTYIATSALGVCWELRRAAVAAEAAEGDTYRLVESTTDGTTTELAQGALPGSAQGWLSLALTFDRNDTVALSLNGRELTRFAGRLNATAGVCGIGTGWNTAVFDDVGVSGAEALQRTPGALFHDLVPGTVISAQPPAAWAGLVLDLNNITSPTLNVTGLGRYRVGGSKGQHALVIVDARTNATVAGPVIVALDGGGACPDIQGMCYASLGRTVALQRGQRYYLVTRAADEAGQGDALLEVTDPSAATTHAHRDGKTSMTYACFDQAHCRPVITGRVAQQAADVGGVRGGDAPGWVVIPEVDTAYGPVGMIVSEQTAAWLPQ
jgi:hypothetical protein